MYYERTKHIDVKMHFIHKVIARGGVKKKGCDSSRYDDKHSPSDEIQTLFGFSWHTLMFVELGRSWSKPTLTSNNY